MDVNARTLKSLEWDRLKSYLVAECSAAVSRELACDLSPFDSPALVELALKENDEALRLLDESVDLSQENLPDFRPQLKRLSAGAALSAGELLALKTILEASARLKLALQNLDQERFFTLRRKSAGLCVFNELVNAIAAAIDADGAIKDDASPLLYKLRREVQRLNAQIKDELLRIINSPAYAKCLQEPLYTMRNGRHVLPVLANMRHSLDGIVHDSSSTGLTIYVEPKSVVELTNTIRIRESEIEREIERLLWELSNKAGLRLSDIEQSFNSLVEADFLSARARLARKYQGNLPEISAEPRLKFLQARHPLLVLQSGSISAVVPNDIILDQELRTLIITGPNTGGKTVYLKTAGLLSLMFRAGLLLPVAAGSAASVFEGIFADIGDEQSLEQNLSTFSSHMSNIVELAGKAGRSALVLLDEIGAGTDPREGVILARVILGHLTARGAFTICSTHYGELKTLAHSQSGYANASMEFDEKTLAPSYRLRAGVAGNSHAIAVAAMLGLPDELVAEAQKGLASAKDDFEHKIDQVEQRLADLAQQEARLAEKEEELRRLEAELKEKNKALAEELRRSKYEAANQFQADWRRARKSINELTANLQKNPSLARAQQAKEKLDSLKKELGWLDSEEHAARKAKLAAGQTVRVRSLNQNGILEKLPEAQGESARVRVGRLKVRVALSDLEVCETPAAKAAVQKSAAKSKRPHDRAAVVASDPVFVRSSDNTLDLRGQRVDAGLAMLERFIDSAYLVRLSPLMVIHGHGTGAMKAAVRDFLRDCAYKNKSRPGEPYEGSDGVTVINFT